MRIGVLIFVAFSMGCFSPHYDNGSLRCAAGDHPCPSGFACGGDDHCYRKGELPDLSPLNGDLLPGSTDLATVAVDMATPLDLSPPPPITFPPAGAWISSGGGGEKLVGASLGVSIGGSSPAGRSAAASGATVTFGFFSSVNK